jgi:hypothetical protein
MGHVKKVLALKKIQPISTFYSDNFGIELSEDFHIHLRNIRIECDHAEFEIIAKTFCKALEKWNRLGKPTKREESWMRGYYHELGTSKIQPIPLLFNNEVKNNELRLEVQKWADCIHLHYKGLRVEFSIKEFKELVEVVKQAADNLTEYSKDNPERSGKFHRACPHNRVTDRVNKQGFWLKPSDIVAEKPYESSFEKEDAELVADIRLTNNLRLARLDIRDLWDITLFHSVNWHPWGCNKDGIFLPLLYRYKFVKMVLESSKDLSENEIKNTDYWKLLHKKITDRPREGGGGFVYENPMEEVRRFMSLIKSINKNGYLGAEKGHVVYKEFIDPLKIIEADGKVSDQRNKDGGFPGLISVIPSSGAYKVHNGLHRLTILKYLWDVGKLASPLILVRKWDDSPFTPSDTINVKYDKKGYPIGRRKGSLDSLKIPLAEEKNRVFRIIRRILK